MFHTTIPFAWCTGYRMLVLGSILLGVGLVFLGTEHDVAAPAARAIPAQTADPRLILRPQTVPITGTLSNGLRLAGTYYPAYPGRNVFRLSWLRSARPLGRDARMMLIATMPGMAMRPIHTILIARDHGYHGTLLLPMFGTYRIAVAVSMPYARMSGTITVGLPLPGR